MSPEYVRPYVKAQTNNDRPAGIAEAATPHKGRESRAGQGSANAPFCRRRRALCRA
jgi:hypothetical protein